MGAFAELHVEYEDGSKDVIATDETWSVKTGEIRYSEIYMGETIDTDAPEITEGNVVVKDFDKAVLTAQENEPVRITEKIAGKELIVTPKGERLVDFGQIITGVVELHVKGEKGQKIVIRHAEVLDKDGNFTRRHFARQNPSTPLSAAEKSRSSVRISHSMDSAISVWKDWKNLRQINLLPV